MENKKFLIVSGLAIAALLVLGGVFAAISLLRQQPEETPAPTETEEPTLSVLPTSDGRPQSIGSLTEEELALAKERQFISSFWEMPEISYEPSAPSYDLPLSEIKDQAINFRDFSRKINIDGVLDPLSQNGFVVVDSPFSNDSTWEDAYRILRDQEVPIFITADSVGSLYQDTLNVVYKEVEEEIFYPSLWELLQQLHRSARNRYESRFQQFGIETDLVTEASRLELAYISTALQLLKPDESQIRESLTDRKFFTPQEGNRFSFTLPPYLEEEVGQEITLISGHKGTSRSPIFLYDQIYEHYNIPAQYKTSEKLKNYYLTITWLNEALFPLWSQADNCENCLLDEQDHAINLVAALLLSEDLAQDQGLKNAWANIYKSISFFRGLETNITYLDYTRAIDNQFGEDANVVELFENEEAVAERVDLLQKEINSFDFPVALGGAKDEKSRVGLRLLRNYHLLENRLFNSLNGDNLGNYEIAFDGVNDLPFTACGTRDIATRCIPTGLDLMSVLGNNSAQQILNETNNTAFTGYRQNVENFVAEVQRFDQNTWHDNAYMAALQSTQLLDQNITTGYPAFMRSTAWDKKTLYTTLSLWTNQSREINVEKASLQDTTALGPLFNYGYVEPQPEFYAELLANINMVKDGFRILQIINENTKSFERLDNLRIVLERLLDLSIKELENTQLSNDDYAFINNFNKHIRSFIGDVKKENVSKIHEIIYEFDEGNRLYEKLDGFGYNVVLYPNNQGEPVLGIGPVFNYTERTNGRSMSDWHNIFKP